MEKVIYDLNPVKELINETINMYVADSLKDFREHYVSENTNPKDSAKMMAIQLKELNKFAKYITTPKTKYTFRCASSNFTHLILFFEYLYDKEFCMFNFPSLEYKLKTYQILSSIVGMRISWSETDEEFEALRKKLGRMHKHSKELIATLFNIERN